ncbi:hypothetical protein VIGAN_08223800 [Vigna angularis var. angularis]|uniref:Uncharacterized protein n=1 Tax=Vigna angularis var. angularis TaxID=157739 RepID=A0A0S3SRN4_PHAAN|nr:hypothetical protein VIGAN_08223800 [Vigna angularis var. angularis]
MTMRKFSNFLDNHHRKVLLPFIDKLRCPIIFYALQIFLFSSTKHGKLLFECHFPKSVKIFLKSKHHLNIKVVKRRK